MSYQILLHEKDGIVQVTFSEPAIKEDHYAALDSAIQLCNEKKISKLIGDFSNLDSSTLSTMDVFSLGKLLAKAKQVFHIAHVFPKHSKVRENIRFASNVESNRGKITREFENVKDAIIWLRSIS
ncbi:MAG: hypothetical protein JW932_05345 [Deltaproteobacteria bacterium]|nr:hypothetical protein [Deltaproteobacteria bacterium]